MAACGVQVYIPHDFCHFKRALPHIFDKSEIEAFFQELDAYTSAPGHLKQKRLAGNINLFSDCIAAAVSGTPKQLVLQPKM